MVSTIICPHVPRSDADIIVAPMHAAHATRGRKHDTLSGHAGMKFCSLEIGPFMCYVLTTRYSRACI